MDFKIAFSILSACIGLAVFYPYIRDIIQGTTRPHLYTWLIWLITQGIATAGALLGGGGFGAYNLLIGTIIVFFVCLLSLRYGSKNITASDTIVLLSALGALIAWWQLNNPALALAVAIIIDTLGYFPTYRKTYYEPSSETLSTWVGFVIATLCALLALSEYNFLTSGYLIATLCTNTIIVILCLRRA